MDQPFDQQFSSVDFSCGRFVDGPANHDVLPPLVWMADLYPNPTLLVEALPAPVWEKDRSLNSETFITWFDPEQAKRAKFILAGRTVCAESLMVLVPFGDMGRPELVRSWEMFRRTQQRLFLRHMQQPVKSIVYLVRDQGFGHGKGLVPKRVDEVLKLAGEALKRHSR